MLRDETEHAPSQQGGRGYSADLGARGSAHDGRTGAVLAQVIGEGGAELRWVGETTKNARFAIHGKGRLVVPVPHGHGAGRIFGQKSPQLRCYTYLLNSCGLFR